MAQFSGVVQTRDECRRLCEEDKVEPIRAAIDDAPLRSARNVRSRKLKLGVLPGRTCVSWVWYGEQHADVGWRGRCFVRYDHSFRPFTLPTVFSGLRAPHTLSAAHAKE